MWFGPGAPTRPMLVDIEHRTGGVIKPDSSSRSPVLSQKPGTPTFGVVNKSSHKMARPNGHPRAGPLFTTLGGRTFLTAF
jgi:hypothetical protein